MSVSEKRPVSENIYNKSYTILTERIDDFRIAIAEPKSPTLVFYLTPGAVKFHADLDKDLKALWRGKVDDIGFFSVDMSGRIFDLNGTELDDAVFKNKVAACIEGFGGGYDRQHLYFLIDSDGLSAEEFATAFQNGKAVLAKFAGELTLSMLIVLLNESINQTESALAIRKKIVELKDQAYDGTSIISNRCHDNSMISINPDNRARYEDFNLLADLILLSNSRNNSPDGIDGNAFYDNSRIKTYSYSNKKRPDDQITSAVLCGIMGGVIDQTQSRRMNAAGFDSQHVLDELRKELLTLVYAELKDLPTGNDLLFLPQTQEPSRRSKGPWESQFHAAGALSGDCLDLFFETNYKTVIDNFFSSRGGREFVKKETTRILREQSVIDLGYHLESKYVDTWSGSAPSVEDQLDLAFRKKADCAIIEQLKKPVVETISVLAGKARGYYQILDATIRDCAGQFIVSDEKIKVYYSEKSRIVIDANPDHYARIFRFPASEEELIGNYMSSILAVVKDVREKDRELFNLDFVDEVVRRSANTTTAQINQEVSAQLIADFEEKRTLRLNQTFINGNPLSYMAYIVNTESELKGYLTADNRDCKVGFLNSGSNTSIEFLAVFSCSFESLVF